jgi:hypothetical protein
MGNAASADNNLSKALRASEETAAANKKRQAASARAAARAAAGDRNEALEEALQLSAAEAASLASAEKKRRAASATRKRAATRASVGARNNAEDRQLQEALQLSAVTAAAARVAAAAADDPRRRQRRKSGTKGAVAALHARVLVGSCPAGVTANSNDRFIQKLVSYLPQEMNNFYTEQHPGHLPEDYDFTPDRGLECVGVIIGFRLSTGVGHFVPYIKINDDWYNGDDEKGVLVRRTNGIPTMQTKYVNSEGIVDHDSTIFSPITFYCRIDTIRPRPQRDYTGTPVFGQSGLTCGPDASQTIFMLADGFYSVFDEKIYRTLEREFDPRLSAWHPEVITEEVLASEIAKLNGILNRILDVPDGLELVDINKFILMMCIRYFSIENTPEESLAVIEITPNITRG